MSCLAGRAPCGVTPNWPAHSCLAALMEATPVILITLLNVYDHPVACAAA